MSRFGIKKMRRRITQSVRTACKFRYIVTYEYLEVKSHEDWQPNELNILWFRGHRTKSSIKPTWSIQIPNHVTKTTTCTVKWTPPYSVELLVTLYKDIAGSSFKKKDYMFVIEDICGTKRKKLAIFPCNLATYVSMDGETSDLEMEFKSLSKKIISAKCGLKIRCEFIKQGSPIDDDMQSNFSHMSEAEEFSRMSELAEVSDEEDYEDDEGVNRYDDIPEVDEPTESDRELEFGQDCDLEQSNNDTKEETQNRKPWSKFVAEMNSFEWKQLSLLRNPLSSNSKKKRIADQLKEKQESASNEDQNQPTTEPIRGTDFDLPEHQEKRLVRVKCFEEDPNDEVDAIVTEDNISDDVDIYDEDKDEFSSSVVSSSNGGGGNGIKGTIREKLRNVTTKTQKLRSLGPSMEEMKELEAKVQEKNATIWNLEKENKELIIENNKWQDDVYKLQKQRDELQTEISELQILVEDLKIRLSHTEAEHKQLQEEEKELLARMNLSGWLCKRGIKGITGRHWRRRWFATDKSGKLYYYKQNNNSSPQGFIDLDEIISVEDQSEDKQDKNMASFNVSVQKRKYELMARDVEEKQKWINALDYLRHWRSHTTKFLTNSKAQQDEVKSADYDDALNPFA